MRTLDEHEPEQEVPDFFSVEQEITRLPDPIKDEQMRQAKWAFNLTIVLGAIGIVTLLAGVMALLFWKINTDKAGLTIGSGIVTDVLSVFAIKFHRETNNRLDEIRRDEHIMRLVAQIGESTARDQAIVNMVKTLRMHAARK